MKIKNETFVQSMSSLKEIPLLEIEKERKKLKDRDREEIRFYKTLSSLGEVEGAEGFSFFGADTISIGYFISEEETIAEGRVIPAGSFRSIVLESRSVSYNNFRQTTCTKTDIGKHLSAIIYTKKQMFDRIIKMVREYQGTNSSTSDSEIEKRIRSIAWAFEVYAYRWGEELQIPTEGKKRSYASVMPKASEEIIQEMISKVDLDRFMQIVAITSNQMFPKKEYALKILRQWAEAKSFYYLLFNKNLWVERESVMEMTESEMSALISNLEEKFPHYAFATRSITMRDWINNELRDAFAHDGQWSRIKTVQSGTKVSGALHNMYKDDIFDGAISQILQNKTVAGKVRVSIDPYDYATVSMNAHNWSSCHRLGGESGFGFASYMFDEATLVAYRTNGKDFLYAKGDSKFSKWFNFFGNFKFYGNSKAWRSMVYFDKDTLSFAIPHLHYPSSNSDLETMVKDILIETIKEKVEVDFSVYANNDVSKIFTDASSTHYNDILRSSKIRGGHIFFPQDVSTTPNFKTGYSGDIYCSQCGEKAPIKNRVFLCSRH